MQLGGIFGTLIGDSGTAPGTTGACTGGGKGTRSESMGRLGGGLPGVSDEQCGDADQLARRGI
jgi:hypothetical protein